MVGRTLTHYEIGDEIGRGGMGIVYEAHDVNLNRDVALKVLPPELVRDPDRRVRFVREAQAAAALQHPNVAVVHEIGEDEGTTFIAMELVAGEQLSSVLSRGSISQERAVAIAQQIGAGLSAAHEKGIVHRDLNPSNILVGAADEVKIIDFGLAKLLGPDSDGGSEIQTAVHAKSSPGQVMGTLCYMSPEQITGQAVDLRTDLWAFGVVLYEMVTGKRAFDGSNAGAIVHAIANGEPALSELPAALKRVVSRALHKDPDRRYQTAGEMLAELGGLSADRIEGRPMRTAAIIFVALALAVTASWLWYRSSRANWARTEALPEIQRLADDEDYVGAFALAQEAEQILADDPALSELWPRISVELSITSEPAGANVFFNDFEAVDETWQLMGQTPIQNHRVPVGFRRLKIEKAGFVTEYRALPTTQIDVALVKSGGVPDEMVRVPAMQAIPWLAGLDPLAGLDLEPFLVDRHEVTNAAYQRFVDDGGYQNEAFWVQDFTKEGRSITWREARESFMDATGRPGPATWQVGSFPKGEEDHPVSGVSWHEAAAYCASVEKSLPTIYHWISISGARGMAAAIVPLSNFDADGTAAAGEHRGMGPYGTFDTAGNLSEWCWNASGGERYLLGGSWSDPGYTFSHAQVRDPFDRSPINGFRCVRYTDGDGVPEEPGRPVELVTRDYRSEEPVSDAVFEVYREQFAYDATPLNAVIDDKVAATERWSVERISLDAAYGDERLSVYLILPRDARPPHQVVVLFPGSTAIFRDDIQPALQDGGYFDFVVKSGRAFAWPVYKNTYERRNDLPSTWPDTSRAYVDRVVQWVQDFRRTVDYLETREEIQADKLAYFGVSWGGRLGAIIPAVEPRIRASILYSGGLASGRALPEVDQINYVTRVTAPTLMLNGRLDSIEPVEAAQLPMYELLGTPEEHKRHRIYESGHIMPLNPIIRETLDWLDTYLGPVNE